ncbi:MAG: GTP-binding protein [Pseudomonadota bacterium]
MSITAENSASAARRQRPKIVFTGSVGAGKTTALKTISSIPPVTTDVRASEEEVLAVKDETTVAMDYGHLMLASGVKVDLYATPGQERFSFMWDILGKGSTGLILLADASRPDPLADLAFFLERFRPIVRDAPMAVGITKADEGAGAVEPLQQYLKQLDPPVPAVAVDAREAVQVKRLVFSLLLRIDPGLLR